MEQASYKLCARDEGVYFMTDGSIEEETALVWIVLTVGEGWEGLARDNGAIPLPVSPFLSDTERADVWRWRSSLDWYDYALENLGLLSRLASSAFVAISSHAWTKERAIRALAIQDRYHAAGQKLDALKALADCDLKRQTLQAMADAGAFREGHSS